MLRCRIIYVLWQTRTFLKRKGGLFKKAHELSVLCSVDVAVIIFGHNKKLYEFSSGDINETIDRYQYVCCRYLVSLHHSLCVSNNIHYSTEMRMSTRAQQITQVRKIWTRMTTTTAIWDHLRRNHTHRKITL